MEVCEQVNAENQWLKDNLHPQPWARPLIEDPVFDALQYSTIL